MFDSFYYGYAGFVKRTFAIRPGEKVAKLVKRMHYVSFVGMLRSDLFEEKLAKDKMLRRSAMLLMPKTIMQRKWNRRL